jgi:hypothetical protein
MRKKRTTPLSLNKETLRALDEVLRHAAGASRGCTMWCAYTESCTCEYPTHTGGTDCCQ